MPTTLSLLKMMMAFGEFAVIKEKPVSRLNKENSRYFKILLVTTICVIVSGCGTFYTLNQLHGYTRGESVCNNIEWYDYSMVYSGVGIDAKLLVCPIWCQAEDCLACFGYYPIIFPACLIDMPISFIADTLLLPYSVYMSGFICKKQAPSTFEIR